MGSRILNLFLLLCVGAVFGTLGTVAHQSTLHVLAADLPWGITVALIAVTSLFVGVRLVTTDRMPALMCAIGVLGAIALFSFKSTGGSVLVPDNALGKVWVIAPIVIAAIVIAWPKIIRRPVSA